MRTILGIDPGTTGAVALYNMDDDEIIGVWDIPNMEREYGKGLQVDGSALYDLIIHISDANTIVFIESVGSMPKQGVVSSFNFGHTVGTIYGIISALELPRYQIHPMTWKKKLGAIGTGKYAVLDMIKISYPETLSYLRLKKHHNRSDAIAIAVIGGQVYGNLISSGQ